MNEAKLELLREWIHIAEVDYKTIKQLFKSEDEILTESICFHCQQCVEKYLKAYLIYKDYNPPKVHDIEHLVELCSNFHGDFKSLEIGNLSDYGVFVRYDDFYVPTVNETKKNLDIVENIRNFVRLKIEGV